MTTPVSATEPVYANIADSTAAAANILIKAYLADPSPSTMKALWLSPLRSRWDDTKIWGAQFYSELRSDPELFNPDVVYGTPEYSKLLRLQEDKVLKRHIAKNPITSIMDCQDDRNI